MLCFAVAEENYDEATMVQQREIENKVCYFLLLFIISVRLFSLQSAASAMCHVHRPQLSLGRTCCVKQSPFTISLTLII